MGSATAIVGISQPDFLIREAACATNSLGPESQHHSISRPKTNTQAAEEPKFVSLDSGKMQAFTIAFLISKTLFALLQEASSLHCTQTSIAHQSS